MVGFITKKPHGIRVVNADQKVDFW
uniref:Uncharacterized protein n=1 Tax=Anguilla anguilla TaxID=7936 RepID=A0A0E9TGC1_ANGAN